MGEISYNALDRKRSAQFGQLTKIVSAINSYDEATPPSSLLEEFKASINSHREVHEKIIDLMLEFDDVDEQKLAEDSESFRALYYNALTALHSASTNLSIASFLKSVERHINDLTQFHESYCEQSVSLEALSIRLADLKLLQEQHQAMWEKLYSAASPADEMDLLQGQKTFSESFNSSRCWLMAEIARRSPPAAASSTLPTASPSAPIVKLPKIELPKFDGTPDSWITFRDSFMSIVHNIKSIAGSTKFRYLKSCITDKNSPINHLLETDDGYEDAWEAVMEFYDDKRRILDSHFSSMLTAKRMSSETHEELQRLLNEYSLHVSSLGRLQTEQELYQAMVAHLVIHRLDSHTRDLWETQNKNNIPLWPALQKFLKERRKTLSTMPIPRVVPPKPATPASLKPAITGKPSWKSSSVHATSNATPSQPSTSKVQAALVTRKCLMCAGDHRLHDCSQYLNSSVPHRLSKIKEWKLCTNCLGSHSLDCCTSPFKCRSCQQKHHTTLHQESSLGSSTHFLRATAEPFEHNSCSSMTAHMNCVSLLQTAIVQIQDNFGAWHSIRAFFDTGSDSNYIAKHIALALKLPMEETHVIANGLGGVKAAIINQKLHAIIGNGRQTVDQPVEFFVTVKVTNPMPTATVDSQLLGIPENLTLADPTFNVPGKIDMLIGNTLCGKLMRDGRLVLPSGPILLNSMFGWVFTGSAPVSRSVTTTQCHHATLNDLTQSLERFYKLEDYRTERRFFTEEETHCEKVFEQTHQRRPSGRFVVTLPFKENVDQLVNNYRSTLCQFLANEKRLHKNPPLCEKYIEFMREYEQLGHMTEVDISQEAPDAPAFYFPHHPVEKPDSSTTSVRVVFNGSAKTRSGLSLNDTQCIGPQIQTDAFTLSLRFRQHPIVIKADIAKMYRQIEVVEHQRPYQRILWRESPNHQLKVYNLNTITYGTASASFESTRCLKQLAIEYKEEFPEAAEEVLSSFYVDDFISGASSVPTAIALAKDVMHIISKGEMDLRKFNSNSTELLLSIPEANRETPKENTSIKALGIKWDPLTDKISFDVKQIDHSKITRRTIVSEVSKIYDPDGLLGPVTFRFKLFLKAVTKLSMPWDSALPEKETAAWTEIARTFPELRNIHVPRYSLIHDSVNIQLHGFCDASDLGYGAAIYLRSQDAAGSVECHLICAKSRVAPTEWKSTARLELCGAVLLSVLMSQVSKALTIVINQKFCWTDSAIVLHWLKKSPSQLQIFVANRVSEIQSTMQDITWRHVRGEYNPADLISRGLMPSELVANSMWWNGAYFLSLPECEWPASIVEIDPNEPSYSSEFKRVESLSFAIHASAVSSNNPENIFLQWIEKSSRTWPVKIKLAPVMRFVFNARARKLGLPRRSGKMQVADLVDSEIALVRMHQQQHFGAEFRLLSQGKTAAPNSSIKNLNPTWDSRFKVIRVGGRLNNAEACSFNQKHPMILPNCNFTKLVVREIHQQHMHAGQKATLGIVRMRFWPIGAKALIRSEIHKCIKCFRARPKLTQQLMGSLPSTRTTPSPPFYHTGVDYCGPFDIKLSSVRSARTTKGYVALFICFATKAIHLEVVSDLTTKAFLAAFDRFSSSRGLPHSMHSDNGLNFVGAHNKLQEMFSFLAKSTTQGEIIHYFKQQEVEWHFIPPRAPEHGGLWEAGVKSMKYHLHRVSGAANLTFEEFYTLIKKIEAILNSRPLTAISDDPNDLTFLTSGHFLIGRPLISKADQDISTVPWPRLERWDRIVQMQQHFWQRWNQDYLHQLQVRTKNYKDEIPVFVGQLVLLHVDNAPTMFWPIGRITKIYPGRDGITRVASIRTSTSTYERPVNKIAILPIDPTDDHLEPAENVRA